MGQIYETDSLADLPQHDSGFRVPDFGSSRNNLKPKTLLLGLGNDLLTDDAVGLRVAEAVRRRLPEGKQINVVATSEMGLSLLDFIVGFDELILVDAVQTRKKPPGFVHALELSELDVLPTVSPHCLGLGEVLALGRKLGMPIPARIRIFAVEIDDPFTVGTEMTPALRAAFPRIVERVTAALQAG